MDIADDALHQILHAISAALLTGDHRTIPQTAAWVADLIRSGAVSDDAERTGRRARRRAS